MFYVYHNWVHHYAMIHLAECPHCNHGHGTQPSAQGVAGEWLGPFANFRQARNAAEATGEEVSICRHCNPH